MQVAKQEMGDACSVTVFRLLRTTTTNRRPSRTMSRFPRLCERRLSSALNDSRFGPPFCKFGRRLHRGFLNALLVMQCFSEPVDESERVFRVTHLPMPVVRELIDDLRHRFSDNSYSLLSNNCNNFSNELAKLLVGQGIPEDIVKLPDEVMSTPFGEMIKPMLMGMESRLASAQEPSRSSIDPRDREQMELEAAIRQEYAVLAAQGSITSAQAAEMAAQRVKEIRNESEGKDDARAK